MVFIPLCACIWHVTLSLFVTHSLLVSQSGCIFLFPAKTMAPPHTHTLHHSSLPWPWMTSSASRKQLTPPSKWTLLPGLLARLLFPHQGDFLPDNPWRAFLHPYSKYTLFPRPKPQNLAGRFHFIKGWCLLSLGVQHPVLCSCSTDSSVIAWQGCLRPTAEVPQPAGATPDLRRGWTTGPLKLKMSLRPHIFSLKPCQLYILLHHASQFVSI